jgi:thiol-disulfide isomerase/thioredoxin
MACHPAAPVSISNKPVSINHIPQTNLPMPTNKPIGEMNWTKLDGKTEKLNELKGKVVVLDFWATNCPPCLKEIPHLNALQTKYGAENLQIVGLHVGDDEDRLRVPKFAGDLKINYTLAYPEEALIGFIFRERSDIPQTLILNRSGNMVERFIGFDETVQKKMENLIAETINEK